MAILVDDHDWPPGGPMKEENGPKLAYKRGRFCGSCGVFESWACGTKRGNFPPPEIEPYSDFLGSE